MIQELLGGGAAGFLNQDRNNLPISKIFEPSPSPSSSTTITTTINATTTDTITGANATNSDTQKLRCPRCDSSNTKFCYYNNYNLTQPRHFCKTCRRYWTKGGALRNVPIGGGCRKNKAGTIIGATATGRLKAAVSCELGKFNGNMEHEYSHNPILWSNPPQTSHLLSLLRATQTPNPNFPLNPQTNVKDFMVGSNMGNLGFEPLGQTQTSSLGLCSSLWRNNQVNQHHDQGMLMTTENNERLRSSHPGNYYHHDDQTTTPLILGSSVANTSSTSTILDSAPVLASGELGFWNQTLRWSDLAAANGAYL